MLSLSESNPRITHKAGVLALLLVLTGPLWAWTLSERLGNLEYSGIYEEPVTLSDGVYLGEPFVAGGATRPRLTMMASRAGQLETDEGSRPIAYVLLTANTGGTGNFLHLAAVGEHDGTLKNIGTTLIGDRVNVVDFKMKDGKAHIDLVTSGPKDPACCPTLMMSNIYGMQNGKLVKQSQQEIGTMSLTQLDGTRWNLIEYDRDNPVPEGISITLEFNGERIAGRGGCNRYFSSVQSDAPGELKIGFIGATRKACPSPQMDAERRFLDALQNASGYSYDLGKLVIHYATSESTGSLVFEPIFEPGASGDNESTGQP